MKIKMMLPALAEATAAGYRSIKSSVFPAAGIGDVGRPVRQREHAWTNFEMIGLGMAPAVETRCLETRCLRRCLGVLGIALALLAPACGSGGESAATSSTEKSASTQGSAGSDETTGSDEMLADVLGPYFDPDYDSTEALNQELHHRVKECMAESGFAWEPSPTVPTVYSETYVHLEPNTREWTERYGFGVTTLYFSQEEVGPDLVGIEGAPDIANMPEDPNEKYLDGLSSTEREAWNTTLSGDSASNTPGCYDTADDEVLYSHPLFWFYGSFGERFEELQAEVQADPRIVDYDADVSRCVEERGLTYQSEEQVITSYTDQLQSMDRSRDAALESAVSESAVSENAVGESGDTADPPPDPSELPPDGMSTIPFSVLIKAQLAELQRQEVELALAVWDCGGADRQEFLEEIYAEYESDFVAANRDELVDLKQNWEE